MEIASEGDLLEKEKAEPWRHQNVHLIPKEKGQNSFMIMIAPEGIEIDSGTYLRISHGDVFFHLRRETDASLRTIMDACSWEVILTCSSPFSFKHPFQSQQERDVGGVERVDYCLENNALIMHC